MLRWLARTTCEAAARPWLKVFAEALSKSYFEAKFIFPFGGALDKYNIYLFMSNFIEDFKLNQYWKFKLILPMRFHIMRYFVNSIISRVSHRLLYCVFTEVDFEK